MKAFPKVFDFGRKVNVVVYHNEFGIWNVT